MSYIDNVTKLDLVEILYQNGYYFSDKSKNTAKSWELTNDQDDKLIVSKYANGDYVYFKRNSSDKGNIINFCKNRGIELKDLIAHQSDISTSKEFIHKSFETKPKEPQRKEIKQELIDRFKSFKPIKESSTIYLNLKRKISKDLISKFSLLKHDEYHNAIVPTYFINLNNKNERVIEQCGYMTYYHSPITKDKDGNPLEKPRKQTCYGSKGLEILCPNDLKEKGLITTKNIIIAESSIDSLSAMEMKGFKPDETIVCATNGAVTQTHIETIKFIQENMTPNAKFILAFDNDKAGKEFANQIKEVTNKNTSIKPVLKDFNDDLLIAKTFNIKPQNFSAKTLLEATFLADKKAKYFIDGFDTLLPSSKKELFSEIKADISKFALLEQKAPNLLDFSSLKNSFSKISSLLQNSRNL